MLVGATPASADSADNDGVNIGNDNNTSVLPVQLCDNNVAVLGAVVPIASPQAAECVNAPIVDHAEQASGQQLSAAAPAGGSPAAEQAPAAEGASTEVSPAEELSADSSTGQESDGSSGSTTEVLGASEDLPTAPSPEVTEGHVAVTG